MSDEKKLKILKLLDSGEITKDQAIGLMDMHKIKRVEDKFSEERSDVGFFDRMKVKNLSNSPEASMEYLKKEYPESDFQMHDGRVFSKAPGDAEYKALDPSGFDVADITDVGYDVAAGALEGLAGTAAGVATAATGAGIPAAIPAAMLASGGAGAGLEALRQKAGSIMGIPQEVSGSDVLLSGALSSAGPLAFGVGGKAAAGAAKSAGQSILEKGMLGAPASYVGRKATGKAGELFTGINSRVWEKIANSKPALDKINKTGEAKVAEIGLTQLSDSIDNVGKNINKGYSQILKDNGDQLVDISSSKNEIRKTITDIASDPAANEADKKMALGIQKQAKEIFGRTSNGKYYELADEIPLRTAHKMKKQLADLVKFGNSNNASSAEKMINPRFNSARGKMAEVINEASPELRDLDLQTQDLIADKNFFRENFLNRKNLSSSDSGPLKEDSLYKVYDKKGLKRLKKAGSGDPEASGLYDELIALDGKYGTTTAAAAEDLAAANVLKNAGYTAKSLGGVTSTSQTLRSNAIGGAIGVGLGSQLGTGEGGNAMNYAAGGALGAFMASPKAFKQYMRMTDAPSMTPAYNQLKNVFKPSDREE